MRETCTVSSSSSQSDAIFDQVLNPFQNSHTATLGSSYASASYDFAWAKNEGRFDVSLQHHLAQLRGDTFSSGRIVFTPSVDSVLSFTSAYTFSWPGSVIGLAGLGIGLEDVATDEIVYFDARTGGNFGLGPPFGTLLLNHTIALDAYREYRFSYSISMTHDAPTPPGTFGSATGAVHFEINPVPEPASMSLLACAMLWVHRCHRQRL